MARIAIITENKQQTSLLYNQLSKDEHEISVLLVSSDVLSELATFSPDLVIYDSYSPNGPDDELLQSITSANSAPTLLLLEGPSELVIVRTLKIGVDDCLVKPYSERELAARIDALLRRYWEWNELQRVSVHRDLVINRLSLSVALGDRQIKLTPTEHRLLTCLAEREGGVVTRKELCQRVWGESEREASEATLNLYIHHLREKIEPDPHDPKYIRTKWGIGYYLA